MKSKKKTYTVCMSKVVVLLCICIVAGIVGCGTKTWKSEKNRENENAKFQTFTANLFAQEVSANTLTLHYTLEHPETYGITSQEQRVALGSGNVDPKQTGVGIENTSTAMKKFTYKELNRENQLTYDVIDRLFKGCKRKSAILVVSGTSEWGQRSPDPVAGLIFRISLFFGKRCGRVSGVASKGSSLSG